MKMLQITLVFGMFNPAGILGVFMQMVEKKKTFPFFILKIIDFILIVTKSEAQLAGKVVNSLVASDLLPLVLTGADDDADKCFIQKVHQTIMS